MEFWPSILNLVGVGDLGATLFIVFKIDGIEMLNRAILGDVGANIVIAGMQPGSCKTS